MNGASLSGGGGDPYGRDDGVGPAVVNRLVETGDHGARLAVSKGEASELIELWGGARLAVVVNAVRAEPAHPRPDPPARAGGSMRQGSRR